MQAKVHLRRARQKKSTGQTAAPSGGCCMRLISRPALKSVPDFFTLAYARGSVTASARQPSRRVLSAFILCGGDSQDIVPEVSAKFTRSSQINFPTEQLREFNFHSRQPKVARHMTWIELYQHINIAFRAKSRGEDRPEEGELTDVMAQAEDFDLLAGQRKLRGNHGDRVLALSIPFGGSEVN